MSKDRLAEVSAIWKELAALPTDWDAFIDEAFVAKLFDVKLKTLRKMRSRGKGPDFVKHGRKVQYRLSAVMEFIDSLHEQRSP